MKKQKAKARKRLNKNGGNKNKDQLALQKIAKLESQLEEVTKKKANIEKKLSNMICLTILASFVNIALFSLLIMVVHFQNTNMATEYVVTIAPEAGIQKAEVSSKEVEEYFEQRNSIVSQETHGDEIQVAFKEEPRQEDVEMLARLMNAEEGVLLALHFKEEPEKVERCFKLAGSALLRRVEVHLNGVETMADVIFHTDAYDSRTVEKVKKKTEKIPSIVYTWARDLLADGPIGPRGLIFQAQFKQGDEVYDHIYNQIFCVANKYNN